MKPHSRLAGFVLLSGFTLATVIPVRAVERIPLESFFTEPECRAMQLAPDGRHLAFLTTLGYGKVGVALMDLTTGKYEALVSAQDENIKEFVWKGSDRIIYAGDIGGDEHYAWRSISILPVKDGGKRRVIPISEAYLERRDADANFMSIMDMLRYDPNHVMAYARWEAGSSEVAIDRVDVRDGHRSGVNNRQPEAASTDSSYVADNNGVLRACTLSYGNKTVVEVSPTDHGPYVKVAEFPILDEGWDLLFFAADNENLYLLSTEKGDTNILYSFNVRTRELSAPLYQAPQGEIQDVLTSWDRSTLYGVLYVSDKPHYHFFDAGRAHLQKIIDASLPETFNRIVSSSQDEQTLLILASSDRDPGSYYVLDRRHGRMGRVGTVMKGIDPRKMQPMEPVEFTSRDGMTIHGYLTRPAGPAGRKVPLIIHPHGGPYGIRDYWGFDPEVQFLANRGYAVLQVNYRGSGGYGVRFEHAGYHEWGGKMQDDLTDAVHWAVNQGIADPARVAIYGASYGGYATLAGLVYTPELYCCGANYVGPGDLNLLVGMGKNRGDSDTNNAFYKKMVGDDRSFLEARSPVNFIDRLRVPLFNAYGFNDPRVDIRQWKRLESKLKEFNKPYEIMIEDNEGHGFYNEMNRIAYYRKLEAFFNRNLPAPTTDRAGNISR